MSDIETKNIHVQACTDEWQSPSGRQSTDDGEASGVDSDIHVQTTAHNWQRTSDGQRTNGG